MTKINFFPDDAETNTAPFVSARIARWLALGAVAGPVLFTLTWLILGFLSSGFTIFGTLVAPYSPISHPISGLGLGPTAPIMNSVFVLSGLLIVAGAVGIFRVFVELSPFARWGGAILVSLTGLGMIIDGIFTLEAVMPHLVGFLLAAATPVVGFLFLGLVFRRIPHLRKLGGWLLAASPLTLALVVLFFMTFDQANAGAGSGVGGLVQRILVLEAFFWYAALGWMAFRRLEQPG